MSDTPRTDAAASMKHKEGHVVARFDRVDADFARQLEREFEVLWNVVGDVASSMDNGWSETLWDAMDKVVAMRSKYEEI